MHLHMNLGTLLQEDLPRRPAIPAIAAPPAAPRVPAAITEPGGTWSRWALLRCMLRAGLLGSTLPQPGTVHRMLVLTWDSSVTEGRTSSRAGGGSPAVGCPTAPPRRPAAAMLLSGARAPLPGAGNRGGERPARHGVPAAQLMLRVSDVRRAVPL